jgi:hypothetical protein
MYTTYFLIGFVTSFGWWSAGKVQKSVDNTAIEVKFETKTVAPAKPTDAK